jgi:hypothetical protein
MAAKAKRKIVRAAPVALAERWTAAKREAFLRALVETANVVGAARLVGLPDHSAYHLRRKDEGFARAWDNRRRSAARDDRRIFGHIEHRTDWREARVGAEWAVGMHTVGTQFVLIEPLALARVASAAAVGGVKVMAVGVGDGAGVIANGPGDVGAAGRPLSPAGLRVTPSGGDLLIGWTRRSRDGWRWRDSVDVPLGEEVERFRVMKLAAGRPDLIVETPMSEWIYESAERAADFAAGAMTAVVSVAQIGSLGVSRQTAITVPTN